MYDKIEKDLEQKNSSIFMHFLSEQITPNSVIYVAFGTQADVSDAQLDEVAFGLEESGFPFLWVVRSETWSLPKEMEEKIEGKGLIFKGWIDQHRILSHRAMGRILESLWLEFSARKCISQRTDSWLAYNR